MQSRNKGNDSQVQTTSVTKDGGRELSGNMYLTGLPIVKEAVTLKMVTQVRPLSGNFAEMKPFKDLESKTNIHINWELIPQAQYIEKKRFNAKVCGSLTIP